MYPKEVLWIGAKGGLAEQKHRRRMGEAVWLFLWLLTRQTDLNQDGEGVVYYGRTISFRAIEEDTDFPIGTLHRWVQLLVQQDYIRIEKQTDGMVFWILNGKRKSKAKCSTSGTVGVPHLERKCSTSGTDFSPNPQIQQQLIENATKRASKLLQYNTTAAAETAAVPSRSIEEQKQELRRKGYAC